MNPSEQKVESSNKAAELPETVVQTAAAIYPPRSKILGSRCFPQGCVAKKPKFNAAVSTKFTDFRTEEKVELSGKATEMPKRVAQEVEKMYPSRRRISVSRCFPQGHIAKIPETNAGMSLISADFRTEKNVEPSNKAAELPERVVQTATKTPRYTDITTELKVELSDKAAELPETVVQTAVKMYPPQTRISVTRYFPQGCVAKNPQINAGVSSLSTDFRTEQKVELSDKAAELPKRGVQTTAKKPIFIDLTIEQNVELCDKAAENDAKPTIGGQHRRNTEEAKPTTGDQHQRNTESNRRSTIMQSDHDCFEAKRAKPSKNYAKKSADRLSSPKEKNKTCRPQEKASIDSENPSHRVIVMALMAPSYYSSMQKKRVKKK